MAYPKYTSKLNLKDNPFVTNDGITAMHSLVETVDQRVVNIKRDFYINGYVSKINSVSAIKDYAITDSFNPIFSQVLNDSDRYFLRFIARFSSVQNIQLINQAKLTNGMLKTRDMWESVNRLQRLGLVQRWLYDHPIEKSEVGVYTLTGNGLRFMQSFYPEEHYFNPMRFWTLPANLHLRFWQMVDVYQLLYSLPAFKGENTMFNGYPRESKMIASSPLQVALELMPRHIVNLCFYSLLEVDNSDYYKDACYKWSKLTNAGNDITFLIPNMPYGKGVTNAISFYSPTYEFANKVSTDLELGTWGFSSLFLIGEQIKSEGVNNAFYMPRRADSNLVKLDVPTLTKG